MSSFQILDFNTWLFLISSISMSFAIFPFQKRSKIMAISCLLACFFFLTQHNYLLFGLFIIFATSAALNNLKALNEDEKSMVNFLIGISTIVWLILAQNFNSFGDIIIGVGTIVLITGVSSNSKKLLAKCLKIFLAIFILLIYSLLEKQGAMLIFLVLMSFYYGVYLYMEILKKKKISIYKKKASKIGFGLIGSALATALIVSKINKKKS